MSIEKYLKDLANRLPDLIAGKLKGEALDEIAPFISDNMKDGRNPNPRKARTDSDPRLYVNSGALLKAATVPNAQGSASEVRYQNGELVVSVGVDLSTVPYARIHEYGGNAGRGGKSRIPARPYIAPALRDYSDDTESGFGALVEDIMSELSRLIK